MPRGASCTAGHNALYVKRAQGGGAGLRRARRPACARRKPAPLLGSGIPADGAGVLPARAAAARPDPASSRSGCCSGFGPPRPVVQASLPSARASLPAQGRPPAGARGRCIFIGRLPAGSRQRAAVSAQCRPSRRRLAAPAAGRRPRTLRGAVPAQGRPRAGG